MFLQHCCQSFTHLVSCDRFPNVINKLILIQSVLFNIGVAGVRRCIISILLITLKVRLILLLSCFVLPFFSQLQNFLVQFYHDMFHHFLLFFMPGLLSERIPFGVGLQSFKSVHFSNSSSSFSLLESARKTGVLIGILSTAFCFSVTGQNFLGTLTRLKGWNFGHLNISIVPKLC